MSSDVLAPPKRVGERRPHSTESVFIILSAKALSSLGFGISLFVIWFGWVMPSIVAAPPPNAEINHPRPGKGHRRTRSAGHKHKVAASRPKRNSLPLPPTPILVSRPIPTPPRHVSFADTQPTPVRRNSAPMETTTSREDQVHSSPPSHSELFSNVVTSSPRSSTSSLPPTNTLPTPPPEDQLSPFLSQPPRPSSAPAQTRPSTPVFRKLRFTFSKRKRNSAEHTPELPTLPDLSKEEEPLASCSKKSHTFAPPWSHNKKGHTADPLACLETASTLSTGSAVSFSKQSTSSKASSNSSCSTSCLSKKAQRRTSTPIPRTMPYEAPYFATPPQLPDDSYSAYLRRLPQFEDDLSRPATPDSPSHTRGRERSQGNSEIPGAPQTRKAIPQRRSASEDWSPRLGFEVQVQ